MRNVKRCWKVLKIISHLRENGFTAEFYKHFFDLIGAHLVESFSKAFAYGELSISQRRGVITLIPKQDSDLLDLQNWRPIITLPNIDYKIQGLKGVLGLQGSGLKNAELQGSKTKMLGLQGSISSPFGLRAPLWSTILRYKNYFATLNQVRKLKRPQFRPVF